jgi:hypothetical protein
VPQYDGVILRSLAVAVQLYFSHYARRLNSRDGVTRGHFACIGKSKKQTDLEANLKCYLATRIHRLIKRMTTKSYSSVPKISEQNLIIIDIKFTTGSQSAVFTIASIQRI